MKIELNSWRCRETVNPEDAVRGSPRSSATAREELPLGVGRRQGGRTLVGRGGLVVPVQPTKQIGSRGVERVVVVQVQLVDQSERGGGAVHLADGDRAVESDDGCWGYCEQVVVEGDDLRPVGLLDCRRVRMGGVDSGLELIRAGVVATEAGAHDPLALLDQRTIPAAAVLLAEQREAAVWADARCAAGLG